MDFKEQYAAITQGVGRADLTRRSQIELLGKDRTTFLHGLCTNDIRGLEPGDSCEAFLTNVQGKAAGYVYVHCLADSLVLETMPGLAPQIIEHLDRYLIREDVQLEDRSTTWSEFLLAGATCVSWWQNVLGWPTPPDAGRNVEMAPAGEQISVRRMPFALATSLLVSCPSEHLEKCQAAFRQAGAVECAAEVVETSRIEAGTPMYGPDVTEQNLPQEVGRTEQAISFDKGCYLGQETVARLDALGHVNRHLVGLQLTGTEPPPAGTVLTAEDKPVARITSACWSPALSAPLALAYVRRGHEATGSQLATDRGTATVVALPVANIPDKN